MLRHTKLTSVKFIAYTGIFVSCALVLSLVEGMIPFLGIAPGVKIGLANIITMLALCWFGPVFALSVGLIRSLLTGILSGAVTMFFYSGVGSVLCVLIMYFFESFFSKYISVIGRSMLGAFFFNIGQIAVAAIAVSNIHIFSYLPVFTFVSAFCGVFTGYIAKKIMEAGYVKFKRI